MTNIVSPNINIDEFEKEKSVVIDEIKQQNDQPDENFSTIFKESMDGQLLWENNIRNRKEVESLRPIDLKNFHKKFYNSENLCIAIAGNLSQTVFEEYYENNLSYFHKRVFKYKIIQ